MAALLPIGETAVAKMRVFRYPIFLGGAFAAGALAVFLPIRVEELLMPQNLGFDVAHLARRRHAVLSFVLLYQDRITAVLNVFALQAIALSLSVAWQSVIQDAPHLLGDGHNCIVGQGRLSSRGAAPDCAPARDPS